MDDRMHPGPEQLDFEKPFDVWRWLRDHSGWPMREKMAYWSLYSRRGSDGRDPHPGMKRLAQDMGCSTNVARTAVYQLSEIGAISIKTRTVEGRRDADTHIYELRPPWTVTRRLKAKPRGMHAGYLPQKESDVPQILRDVPPNQEDGPPKTGGPVPLNLRTKEPKEGANERDNKSLPPAEKSRAKRRSTTSRISDEEAAATQAITAKLHDLLRAYGLSGIPSQAWGAARKIAGNAIKGTGGPAIPVDEAIAALEWAFAQDDFARRQLIASGMKVLRNVWAAWRERGSRRGVKRFRDPSAGGPQMDPNSPWS